jgi:hypothetical protein
MYYNPTQEVLDKAKALHAFLTHIRVTQLEEGFSFHIEVAKDNEGNIYRDIFIIANSQYTVNGDKFISNGGIAINIQPLINFLSKVIDPK